MSDAQRHAKQAKREREARGVEAVSAAALLSQVSGELNYRCPECGGTHGHWKERYRRNNC